MKVEEKRRGHSKTIVKHQSARKAMYSRVSADDLSKLAETSMRSARGCDPEKATFIEIE